MKRDRALAIGHHCPRDMGVPSMRVLGAPVLVCGLLLACGTERPPPAIDPTNDNTNTKDDASVPSATPDGGPSSLTSSSFVETVGPVEECVVPIFEDNAPELPFVRLSATVVDEQGEPVADILAQACGTNVCLQAKTDSQGRVTISEDTNIAKLAFKYGDGLRYAQIVAALPDEEEHELGSRTTLRLPDGTPENRFIAGASLVSSDAELEIAAESSVKIDVLSYPDETQHVFVAREFERDVLPPSIEAEDFAAVWVFGPQKTQLCPPAKLTIPNTASLAAGSGVELFILVTGIEGHFARYAEWGKVGTATVSDDGSRIETDPNSGLPELGIIGLRSTSSSTAD